MTGSGVPSPLRVLVVEASLRENGGVRLVLDHVARWQRAGDEVVLAVVQEVLEDSVARPDPALGVRHLSAPGARARRAALPALLRLVRLARRSNVVVSGSEEGNGLLLGRLAATLARRPYVIFAQCDVEASVAAWVPCPLQRITRRVHATADATVCVAESVRDGLVGLGLPPERAHVVPNGVDVAAVRARAAAEPSVRVGPRTVVGCGRLTAAKGFDVLLRAHARLRREGTEHRLLLLGEGPDRPVLERLADELGVRDSVDLPGFVDDAPAVIGRAAVFALSSRFEGAPLVLLEALALGVPVVATRCASAVEEIVDARYVVPVDAPDALALAIRAALVPGAEGAGLSGPVREAADAAEGFRSVLRTVAARRLVPGQSPGPAVSTRSRPSRFAR